MKTWNKFWSYFETIITIMMTICIIIGTDYEKLNNTKNILIYCFIVGNGILGVFILFKSFIIQFLTRSEING